MVTATRSKGREPLPDLEQYGENLDWFEAHRRSFKKYTNRFVAVDGGRVIGVADSADELYKRFANRQSAYIAWVEPEDLLWV